MPNPYNNKVALRDGTVIMDISDTTATSSTVLSGSSFYDATGAKVNGGVSFVSYYTGSGTPSASLGVNGDIYLQE